MVTSTSKTLSLEHKEQFSLLATATTEHAIPLAPREHGQPSTAPVSFMGDTQGADASP